jgi:hypothetical protein
MITAPPPRLLVEDKSGGSGLAGFSCFVFFVFCENAIALMSMTKQNATANNDILLFIIYIPQN